MFYSKKKNHENESPFRIYFWSICLLTFLLFSSTSTQAQIVHGFKDPNFKGVENKITQTGEYCAHGEEDDKEELNFQNDEMSSIKVRQGYTAWLYLNCPYTNNKDMDFNIGVTGNISDFSYIFDKDGDSWNNEVSYIKVSNSGYLNRKVENGEVSMYNPYRRTYTRSGMSAGTDNSVETTKTTSTYGDEFYFTFIKNSEGHYYIFSSASGKALMPEGANEKGYGQINSGTKLTSYEFGGQEKWATYQLTNLGENRYIISPTSNTRLAITMGKSSGSLTFEPNKKGAGQQFEISDYRTKFSNEVLPPKVNKNAPPKEQYSLLEYSGAGESSSHKEISVQVPFYMVNDSKLSFQKMMKESPYYTLERQEFVKSMTGNEWKYNRSNSDFQFATNTSTTNTQGRGGERTVETGFEQSFTVEASSMFLTASSTTTFSLNLGFTSNWYNEYSKTIGSSTSMKIKPCSKGKLYALANKITLKRKDGSIVKSFVIYKEGSEQFTSVPLKPNECLDLGKKEHEDAKFRYERYNKLTKPTTTTTTPTTPKPPTAEKPVTGISNFTGLQRIQNRWKQTEYIHNENGQAECGEIKMGWFSARWTIEPVADMPGMVHIRNFWKKNEYLHIENGKLESGTIQPAWESARWKLEPVDGNSKMVRIRNFWKKDQFIHIENGKLECSPAEAAWWSAMWNISAVE